MRTKFHSKGNVAVPSATQVLEKLIQSKLKRNVAVPSTTQVLEKLIQSKLKRNVVVPLTKQVYIINVVNKNG